MSLRFYLHWKCMHLRQLRAILFVQLSHEMTYNEVHVEGCIYESFESSRALQSTVRKLASGPINDYTLTRTGLKAVTHPPSLSIGPSIDICAVTMFIAPRHY